MEIYKGIAMVKELVHDPIFLGQKSETTTAADLQVSQDLLDTLIAHKETCVGMAANMISVKKRIICFDDNGTYKMCPPSKNGHKKASKNEMNRSILLIY